MGRERKGYLLEKNGRKYIRLQFTDAAGRKRDIQRKVQDPKNWRRERARLLRELEQHGERQLDGGRMTFAELCDYYESRYVRPAEYVDGRKVAGVRSLKAARSIMKALRAAFGGRALKSITYGELESFKQRRLKTPTRADLARHGREKRADPRAALRATRSIASVNRELSTLRRMLNVAVREGWLVKNPFKAGDALISLADERKRERILSRNEEARLLAACTGKRTHLRTIIVAAVDTGCRLGELLKLRWRDVDLEEGVITIQAFNTKTARGRVVSVTARLASELARLRARPDAQPGELVFGIRDNVKRAFDGARRAAGMPDLRLHDLRHTHGSRLDELGFSLAKIGAQLGHTQVQTTLRYVNRDRAGVMRVANALDAFNAGQGPAETREAERRPGDSR